MDTIHFYTSQIVNSIEQLEQFIACKSLPSFSPNACVSRIKTSCSHIFVTIDADINRTNTKRENEVYCQENDLILNQQQAELNEMKLKFEMLMEAKVPPIKSLNQAKQQNTQNIDITEQLEEKIAMYKMQAEKLEKKMQSEATAHSKEKMALNETIMEQLETIQTQVTKIHSFEQSSFESQTLISALERQISAQKTNLQKNQSKLDDYEALQKVSQAALQKLRNQINVNSDQIEENDRAADLNAKMAEKIRSSEKDLIMLQTEIVSLKQCCQQTEDFVIKFTNNTEAQPPNKICELLLNHKQNLSKSFKQRDEQFQELQLTLSKSQQETAALAIENDKISKELTELKKVAAELGQLEDAYTSKVTECYRLQQAVITLQQLGEEKDSKIQSLDDEVVRIMQQRDNEVEEAKLMSKTAYRDIMGIAEATIDQDRLRIKKRELFAAVEFELGPEENNEKAAEEAVEEIEEETEEEKEGELL